MSGTKPRPVPGLGRMALYFFAPEVAFCRFRAQLGNANSMRFGIPFRRSYLALGSQGSDFARQAEMRLTHCHV